MWDTSKSEAFSRHHSVLSMMLRGGLSWQEQGTVGGLQGGFTAQRGWRGRGREPGTAPRACIAGTGRRRPHAGGHWHAVTGARLPCAHTNSLCGTPSPVLVLDGHGPARKGHHLACAGTDHSSGARSAGGSCGEGRRAARVCAAQLHCPAPLRHPALALHTRPAWGQRAGRGKAELRGGRRLPPPACIITPFALAPPLATWKS